MSSFSKKESNPVYSIVKQFKLLLLSYEGYEGGEEAYTSLILSKLGTIFRSKAVAEVFTYFCRHGAASAWVIQCRLGLPEATAYRVMKSLRALGFIVPALKVTHQKRSKGGPRPVIWVIEGADPKDVVEALKVHNQMLSPKFRVAEKIADQIFADYEKTGKLEINYHEIVRLIKKQRLPFRGPDIPELTARYLHEKGMKVWR